MSRLVFALCLPLFFGFDCTDDGSADDTAGTSTDSSTAPPAPSRFKVVTYNVGTPDIRNADDYGNGLAYVPAVEAVRAFFAAERPAIVGFQEIFHSPRCAEVPEDRREGFVCETWEAGDPTVVQVVLGEDYQVACHPGKDDKCVAVRRDFGSIRQCDDPAFCLEGLDGERVEDCGGGARVARATIDLVQGGEITVVHVHGTSGILGDDAECRAKQVRQIFEDMDGEPGANGERHVILGDLNVDPKRVPGWADASVERWNQYVGGNQPFQWVSDVGEDATPTYLLFNIDHVVSDAFTGSCRVPGVDGEPAVYDDDGFDHKPIVCDLGQL